MAEAALKQQEAGYAQRFQSARAQATREQRGGAPSNVVAFPQPAPPPNASLGAAPGTLPPANNNLGFQEQLASNQARARTAGATLPMSPYLAANQENIPPQQFEEYRSQLASLTQQFKAATTLAQKRAILFQVQQTERTLGNLTLTGKEREELEEARDWFWRAVRVGLPTIDDLSAGWTFGLGTGLSYVVWVWQFVKMLKYKWEDEPIKLTAIFTPSPLKIRVNTKDVGKLLNRMVSWFVDALGFVYTNFQAGIVVVIILIMMILLYMFYIMFTDPLMAATDGTIRAFADAVGYTAPAAMDAAISGE